jgi:hypothetical protein
LSTVLPEVIYKRLWPLLYNFWILSIFNITDSLPDVVRLWLLISSNWILLSKSLVKVLGVWFLKTILYNWIGTASFNWTFYLIGTIPTILNSITNYLLMSLLSLVLPSYYRRLDNPLVVVYLVPLIYLILKSNSWIHTSQ